MVRSKTYDSDVQTTAIVIPWTNDTMINLHGHGTVASDEYLDDDIV